jgi:hypothetical protein
MLFGKPSRHTEFIEHFIWLRFLWLWGGLLHSVSIILY